MNYLVTWETPNGHRTVALRDWNELNHLVNVLGVKEFKIEVFEYTK